MRKDPLALNRQQFNEIMKEIWMYHRFGALSGRVWDDEKRMAACKHIKYIRPNWDMRDGMCFSITFDPPGKSFGSGYGETVPLFDQIMNWLNSPPETKREVKAKNDVRKMPKAFVPTESAQPKAEAEPLPFEPSSKELEAME